MLKHLLRMMPKVMDLMSSITCAHTHTHKRRKKEGQNRWKKEKTVSVLELESLRYLEKTSNR